MGFFGKKAAPAEPEAPPAPKKGWRPWSVFGKKAAPAEPEAPPAVGAPQAPVTAAGPAVTAAPAAVTPAPKAKKGWDFMGILGVSDTPKPPPAKPPVSADPDAPAVAYEEKGVARANPSMDDPNLETNDDRI